MLPPVTPCLQVRACSDRHMLHPPSVQLPPCLSIVAVAALSEYSCRPMPRCCLTRPCAGTPQFIPPEGLEKEKWQQELRATKWFKETMRTQSPADQTKVLAQLHPTGVLQKWDMWSVGVVLLLLLLRRVDLSKPASAEDHLNLVVVCNAATTSLCLPAVDEDARGNRDKETATANAQVRQWAAANITGSFRREAHLKSRDQPSGYPWVKEFWTRMQEQRKMDITRAGRWDLILGVVDGCLRFCQNARWSAKHCLSFLEGRQQPSPRRRGGLTLAEGAASDGAAEREAGAASSDGADRIAAAAALTSLATHGAASSHGAAGSSSQDRPA